jgi:hypothetical protein
VLFSAPSKKNSNTFFGRVSRRCGMSFSVTLSYALSHLEAPKYVHEGA